MIRLALGLLALSLPIAARADEDAGILPFHEVVKIINSRIAGRPLAARIDEPRPFELALGSNIIHEVTLLSPQGNIILVRLDGETGRFLEMRGRGILAARVPVPPRDGKAGRRDGRPYSPKKESD